MSLDATSESTNLGSQITDESMSSTPWFLAYTRPKLETVALFNLQQQGFNAYLPLYKELRMTAQGTQAVHVPMFARYVFFRPSRTGQSIAPVHSTRGVAQVVRFGFELASLGDQAIQSIREFERMRNAADMSELGHLQAGAAVRFRNPALRGLEGLVTSVSKRRVAVLMEFMGQKKVVTVEHQLLEVV